MTAAEQKELRLFAVKVREGILRSTHAAIAAFFPWKNS